MRSVAARLRGVAGALVDLERAQLVVERARKIAQRVVDEADARAASWPSRLVVLRRLERPRAPCANEIERRRHGRAAAPRSVPADTAPPRVRDASAEVRRDRGRFQRELERAPRVDGRIRRRPRASSSGRRSSRLRGRGVELGQDASTDAASATASRTRDLDQAIVERRRAAQIGERLRRHGVGVAAVGRQLLPPDRRRHRHARTRACRPTRRVAVKLPRSLRMRTIVAIRDAARGGIGAD